MALVPAFMHSCARATVDAGRAARVEVINACVLQKSLFGSANHMCQVRGLATRLASPAVPERSRAITHALTQAAGASGEIRLDEIGRLRPPVVSSLPQS